MVHAIPDASHPLRLDRHRILAGAGALAFNAGLLLLLLIPITAPRWLPEPIRPPEITIFDPIQPKRVPPVPVLPDDPMPPPSAHVQPAQPAPVAQPPDQPIIEAVVEPMASDTPAENLRTPPRAAPGQDLSPPSPTGTVLSYAHAPPPPYPRDALLAGIEGTVLLEVLVDIDGRPLEAGIARSSGDRDLDRAARRQVLRHWRFDPAFRDGRPVQARGLVPIEFSLD